MLYKKDPLLLRTFAEHIVHTGLKDRQATIFGRSVFAKSVRGVIGVGTNFARASLQFRLCPQSADLPCMNEKWDGDYRASAHDCLIVAIHGWNLAMMARHRRQSSVAMSETGTCKETS